MKYNFVVPCLMGVESLVADELKFKGFEGVQSENGRVLFSGDMAACAKANIMLRTGERVLMRLASFPAETFEQLFEGVKEIEWESYIGKNDTFPVKGYCLGSKLYSESSCQSIIKKAAVERLKGRYGVSWLEETGPRHQIQFAIIKDTAEIYLDTTGAALYKRGYKLATNEATLRETLAAALVKIARYKGREPLVDPFCGSGTIAIEAAQAALDIQPGARREFECERWGMVDKGIFARAREEAMAGERHEVLPISASDLDPACVKMTEENAERAGVGGLIEVCHADARRREYPDKGVIITNPPYGQRLMDLTQARGLYKAFGSAISGKNDVKKYILSSDEEFEKHFGQRADKKRKLYNGMIKCDLFMYYK